MSVRAAAALAAFAIACTPAWKREPHDLQYQRSAPPTLHQKPQPTTPHDWWDHALHSTVRPLARALSPARYLDALTGGRRALDVNQLGEVPDSPWFENRIGRYPLSVEDMHRGPNRSGPPPKGPLVVVSGKTEGATPGIVVRDTTGTLWFAKLDPPAYPEMSTAAEIIASRLLWAAGYHVPETYLLELDLSRLRLAPDAHRRDRYHRKIPLRAPDLHELVTQLNPDSDGRLRVLFSRAVPGEPLGPFSYRGVRADDPNDRIPHERRRSLRALAVFSAWINNTDTRQQNTLDTFIAVDGNQGFVRHYLIDFGDSLGAAGNRQKYVSEGYEHIIDWGQIGARLFSFGARYPYWHSVKRSPFRAIGIFEGKVFDPARWKPQFRNPAFDELTSADAFWAASIIARFTKEQILAAVTAASYSNAGSAHGIWSVLRQRRIKLLRWAFRTTLPLVDPTVENDYELQLTDLAVRAGLIEGAVTYAWRVRWNRTGAGDKALGSGTTATPSFDLRDAVRKVMRADARFKRDPYLTLTVWRPHNGTRGPRLEVHLRVVRDHLVPVAIRREPGNDSQMSNF